MPRSGSFSDLNSACSKMLVTVKIFQFHDMLNENRFLGIFLCHEKRLSFVYVKCFEMFIQLNYTFADKLLLYYEINNLPYNKFKLLGNFSSVFEFEFSLLN